MSNGNRKDENARRPITIIGTGAWGTTLAIMIAQRGAHVMLVARSASRVAELVEHRENRTLLPGFTIPESVNISHDLTTSIRNADIVLLVVPSQQMRAVASSLRSVTQPDCVVASFAKGLEQDTLLRMTEVIASASGVPADRICAVSGPNLAREIAAGMPASTVVASGSLGTAQIVQSALSSPSFRVYSSEDVIGVELGGALKNVIALAAGVVDGLGAGHNAKAAIITRGLAEMTRLGVATGANPFTFSGLSGLGDLIATCESPLSRNRTFGEQLGRGVTADEALEHTPHVVEGIVATRSAVRLSRVYGVDMPIATAVHEVLDGRVSMQVAIRDLMTRAHRSELDERSDT